MRVVVSGLVFKWLEKSQYIGDVYWVRKSVRFSVCQQLSSLKGTDPTPRVRR
jgi:hypothetical protein